MKKVVFILILAVIAVALWFYMRPILQEGGTGKAGGNVKATSTQKREILRFALVADSENENDLLVKALNQAKGQGINFVIGLGDWSSVGTDAELAPVKKIFDDTKIPYFLTAGDHDVWDSRNRGDNPLANFEKFFGSATQAFDKNGIQFVIVDNSDIYLGISDSDWKVLNQSLADCLADIVNKSKVKHQKLKLCFVFAHKTPFHPTSGHVMGEGNAQVAKQAKEFLDILETSKVDGLFTGDLHFFAEFSSKGGHAGGKISANTVKITTVGAAGADRNFQGPRYAIVTVYNDYSWQVENKEIR